jgi:hypothetical protein
MSERFIQELDSHDESTLDNHWGPILETKALQRFGELYANEWAPYADSARNMELLKGWIFGKGVPITLRNLRIAFDELVEDGLLQKSETFGDEVDAYQGELFLAQCPEYDRHYASRKNSDILLQWLAQQGLAVTADNLQKAFESCVKTRRILPAEKGFATKNGKIEIGPAELQLRAEEHDYASSLSEKGKPVSKELKHAYHASLKKEHAAGGASRQEIMEARAKVNQEHPLLDIYSKEFSSLVSAEILRNRS